MIEKYLGKIRSAKIGHGGYDNAMLGITFDLGGEDWATSDFWNGGWGMEVGNNHKWTHEDRIKTLGETFWRLKSILNDAKVSTLDELKGKPVEAIFEDMKLSSWRILKEVL